MTKLSAIIPTLQKNKILLDNLIATLDKDNFVEEIIVIDNSCRGYSYNSTKLRVIIPNENLFVNPSWNLGVKEAKNDIVALLNDDITVPNDFCKDVSKQFDKNIGCIGFCIDFIKETHEVLPPPLKTELKIEEIPDRWLHWGVAIFMNKSNYVEIPNEIKIYCGDDWIIYNCKKNNKKICQIVRQEIYHYGSLSSSNEKLLPICKRDKNLYKKLTKKWWQNILNIEFIYKGFRITVLGIKFLHHYDKKHLN